MRKKLLWFYVLILFTGKANAQNAHLRITSLLNFPDTAYQGITYPVGFRLQNVGLAPFTGPLQVILQTDTAYDILYFSQNPNFALFPNDTVTLFANQQGILGYEFSPQVFKPGNDVVVVWPYSTQTGVDYDSIYTSVYFVPLSTVAGQDGMSSGGIRVYPNPFSEEIFIEPPTGQIVEQVRIYSLDGKEMAVRQVGYRYELIRFSPGIYIVKATMADGRSWYFRVVKGL